MKLGVNIKVDVSKLDKARFFSGEKGTYADLTAFIDTENPDKYDNHGAVKQATSKDERLNGVKMPICGNVKVFYRAESEPKQEKYPEPDNSQFENSGVDGDDSLPF